MLPVKCVIPWISEDMQSRELWQVYFFLRLNLWLIIDLHCIMMTFSNKKQSLKWVSEESVNNIPKYQCWGDSNHDLTRLRLDSSTFFAWLDSGFQNCALTPDSKQNFRVNFQSPRKRCWQSRCTCKYIFYGRWYDLREQPVIYQLCSLVLLRLHRYVSSKLTANELITAYAVVVK